MISSRIAFASSRILASSTSMTHLLDRKLAEPTHGVRADGYIPTTSLSRRAGYPRTSVLVHRSVTHDAEQEYEECQCN